LTEFPESQPALEDLGICLQKTDLRSYLTTKLQSALETRLLHPGANTVDILITYVAAIRALRLLDPSGVLLDTVTTPVRQYLRQVISFSLQTSRLNFQSKIHRERTLSAV
jgi:anaphase-promoting complex subunit 2